MATTLFPTLDVVTVTLYLAGVMVVLATVAVMGLSWLARHTGTPSLGQPPVIDAEQKLRWRMPPMALLQPVTWSAGTKLGMLALRAYIVVGAVLLIVKAVQLSHG